MQIKNLNILPDKLKDTCLLFIKLIKMLGFMKLYTISARYSCFLGRS